jgi:hypothetical protein
MKKWILSLLALSTAFAVIAQNAPAKKVVAPGKKAGYRHLYCQTRYPGGHKTCGHGPGHRFLTRSAMRWALALPLIIRHKVLVNSIQRFLPVPYLIFCKENPTLIDNSASSTILNNYMTRLQNEKSKFNKQEGELFLAANKKRAEVTTTESGLQYEVLVQGTGERAHGGRYGYMPLSRHFLDWKRI